MVDLIVVGAGIVGLASALKIKERYPHLGIKVIEKENKVAQHQTGHNSGVIHSGLYYRPGSLKAQNCFYGRGLMLQFCRENDIKIDICGKLIAATDESELDRLKSLFVRGQENGLNGLRLLDSKEAKEFEPYLECKKALHVPSAGIIDYSLVCKKMQDLLEEKGVEFHFNEKVLKLEDNHIYTSKSTYETKYIINCAGLFSDRLYQGEASLRIIPFRGEYYTLNKNKEYLVKNLIYPVPDPSLPFLGVHLTRMIKGGIEAGPNAVLALKREGYSWKDFSFYDNWQVLSWPGFYKLSKKYFTTGINEILRSFSKKRFAQSLQKFIPEIQESDITAYGSGVRAQACDVNGNLIDDFFFEETPKVLHVLNAPSPAATSSLSIGEKVSEFYTNSIETYNV